MEKEMATHSSILAWRIPGTEEPGGLPSMGSHRVRHNWRDLAAAAAAVAVKRCLDKRALPGLMKAMCLDLWIWQTQLCLWGPETSKDRHSAQQGFHHRCLSTHGSWTRCLKSEVNDCQVGFLSSLDVLGCSLGQRLSTLAAPERQLGQSKNIPLLELNPEILFKKSGEAQASVFFQSSSGDFTGHPELRTVTLGFCIFHSSCKHCILWHLKKKKPTKSDYFPFAKYKFTDKQRGPKIVWYIYSLNHTIKAFSWATCMFWWALHNSVLSCSVMSDSLQPHGL